MPVAIVVAAAAFDAEPDPDRRFPACRARLRRGAQDLLERRDRPARCRRTGPAVSRMQPSHPLRRIGRARGCRAPPARRPRSGPAAPTRTSRKFAGARPGREAQTPARRVEQFARLAPTSRDVPVAVAAIRERRRERGRRPRVQAVGRHDAPHRRERVRRRPTSGAGAQTCEAVRLRERPSDDEVRDRVERLSGRAATRRRSRHTPRRRRAPPARAAAPGSAGSRPGRRRRSGCWGLVTNDDPRAPARIAASRRFERKREIGPASAPSPSGRPAR